MLLSNRIFTIDSSCYFINNNHIDVNDVILNTTIYKSVYGEENYPYTKYNDNTKQYDF